MPRRLPTGSGHKLLDSSVSWANSEGANSEKALDLDIPPVPHEGAKYLVVVRNPSTETALTVSVRSEETLDATRYPELTSFSVPANTAEGKAQVVEGWLLGESGRLAISNDSAIGAAGAFTAEVIVRRL